jgi:hypothetical protein
VLAFARIHCAIDFNERLRVEAVARQPEQITQHGSRPFQGRRSKQDFVEAANG